MVDLVESREQITHAVPFVATSKDNNKSSLIEQEFEHQNPFTLKHIVIQIQRSGWLNPSCGVIWTVHKFSTPLNQG
jgi:hypothetical protein